VAVGLDELRDRLAEWGLRLRRQLNSVLGLDVRARTVGTTNDEIVYRRVGLRAKRDGRAVQWGAEVAQVVGQQDRRRKQRPEPRPVFAADFVVLSAGNHLRCRR
jgi:hypothetical protein